VVTTATDHHNGILDRIVRNAHRIDLTGHGLIRRPRANKSAEH
jgi:hypothetical protein